MFLFLRVSVRKKNVFKHIWYFYDISEILRRDRKRKQLRNVFALPVTNFPTTTMYRNMPFYSASRGYIYDKY